MDPVSQILAQSQGGSANGQGFGQFFAEGVRMGQQQQQLNLSRRRLDFEEEQERKREPLMELQKMATLQRLALGSLELQKTQSDNSYAVALRTAELEVSRFMSSLAQDGKWGSPESWSGWNDITSRVPMAAVTKSGQLFLQQQRLAMANQQLAAQFGGRPSQVQIPTPEGGSATYGGEELRRQRLQNELRRLELEEARLVQSGDRNALASIRLRKDALLQGIEIDGIPAPTTGLQQPAPAVSTSTNVAPSQAAPAAQTPAPPVTFRQVERPQTQTSVNDLQKQNRVADQAVSALSNAQKVVQEVPEAFGVGGIGRELLETATGQFNPNQDPKISNARHAAGLAFVQVADMLRTDTGNMSLFEQQRLKELGDIRQWQDYPERAAGKLKQIKEMVIARKLRTLKSLNAKADDSLLREIDQSGFIGMVQSGLISEADARRWRDLHRTK